MEIPKFTIVYNKKSNDGFVGVCWEFYTDDNKAQARYDELSSEPEKYSVTKRPYYHDTDKHHLGAGHWELKNSPNIFDKKVIDTETPIAKLRNQLSPYYSLPDMILLMDEKPEMKALLIEQAKRAKATNERILELLTEIEGHQSSEKEFTDERGVLEKFFDENDTDLQGYIKVRVTMHDYDNWNNGYYKGKMHEVVPDLMEKIKLHTIRFAEYLHKYYPNIMKPKNYREVPIKQGERVWMKAFFDNDYGKECTTIQLYDEFLKHK